LLPRYIETQLLARCSNLVSGEHAARMTGDGIGLQKNAAMSMIALTLHMNKVRQAGYHKEIIEIRQRAS